jgi:hypothetical protein
MAHQFGDFREKQEGLAARKGDGLEMMAGRVVDHPLDRIHLQAGPLIRIGRAHAALGAPGVAVIAVLDHQLPGNPPSQDMLKIFYTHSIPICFDLIAASPDRFPPKRNFFRMHAER